MLCFRKFPVAKKFMDKRGGGGRGGGISRFSVEIILSHSTKKFRTETLPGFSKNLVSKLFMHKRGGGEGGGGG